MEIDRERVEIGDAIPISHRVKIVSGIDDPWISSRRVRGAWNVFEETIDRSDCVTIQRDDFYSYEIKNRVTSIENREQK